MFPEITKQCGGRSGKDNMVHLLKTTVLTDNTATMPFLSEWGLSILIEADEKVILLDTGASGIFAKNAEQLGIDLSFVDFGVLSHAHYDHSDGMDTFFTLNNNAPFLVRSGSRENCFGIEDGALKYIGIRKGLLEEYKGRIKFVDNTLEIADGIWLVPHRSADYSAIARRNDLYTRTGKDCIPDSFCHEQSLVIDTKFGLVIFNSCSHTGMSNILEDVKEALGRKDIYAYVGGLHLYKLTDAELDGLCEEIERNRVEQILTGHCTGDHAFAFLHERLGDRIRQFCSGFTWTIS